jgi:sugar fermentation stimulation protein A
VGKTLVGINTGLPNALVHEAIDGGAIPELAGYACIRREVPFGEERSRVDLVLEGPGRPACYVEVKNVTAAVTKGVALFPDCVSDRGSRHLRELIRLKAAGLRPVQMYCVQRGDVKEVRPADGIDVEYGRMLREAIAAGVEVLAYRARITPDEIRLERRIPVVCP